MKNLINFGHALVVFFLLGFTHEVNAQESCGKIQDPLARLACLENSTFDPALFFDIYSLAEGNTLGESLPGSGCFGCDADGTPIADFGFGMSAQLLQSKKQKFAILTTENLGKPRRCIVSYYYEIEINKQTESGYETNVNGIVFTDVFRVYDGVRTFRLTPRRSGILYEWKKLGDIQWLCRFIEPKDELLSFP